MNQFFVVPSAMLKTAPPPGTWHACDCPGDPTLSVVVVQGWRNEQERDMWDELPGTIELHGETWGQVVPARLATALVPWGVLPTDTVRQALRKLRRAWPAAHP